MMQNHRQEQQIPWLGALCMAKELGLHGECRGNPVSKRSLMIPSGVACIELAAAWTCRCQLTSGKD